MNISQILSTVSSVLKSNLSLNSIQLKVDVVQIKEWNTMAFLEISDETGSMSATIKSYGTKIKPTDSISVVGNIESYKGKVQLNITKYNKSGQSKNVDDLNKLISELKESGIIGNKKKDLPKNIKNIGIISSKNAAGLKDFMHIINSKSGFNIYLYESSVQGLSAPAEIKRAVKLANKHNVCDILCLIRGGGSKDDLSCFNNKDMAISVATSKIPTICGIGHEIDTSIVDLVVDRSFITPSAVAQFIITSSTDTDYTIKRFEKLRKIIISHLNRLEQYIYQYKNKLFKMRSDILINLGDTYVNKYSELDSLKNDVVTNINLSRSYIINANIRIKKYSESILNKLDLDTNRYLDRYQLADKINSILVLYDNKIKSVTNPQIVDENDSLITTLEDFKLAKKVIIKFIDGSIEYKNKSKYNIN